MGDIVRGEASESDEEITGINLNRKNILAAELPGEASETSSDEDVYDKSLEPNEESKNVDSIYCNNLLQRKLIDNNLNIWRSLNTFTKSLVIPSSKQLLTTDQLLIKSQIAMQSVLVILNQTQSSMKKLHEKSNDIFTANFIPNINISTKKQ
ncbi:biogenesis of lysosome-related organelles complex 1 subunit 3 [Stomoxys calcitrans]|uniref:Biogenesis of lysosome-related organelles complex 1 subunit 3 n=1 Tax=Stomoxys calcitrans TaxID=35570 RepID=A0A1I8PNM2_STOCA|nr:biogenesis of lysosome-related organelles complex 1 subunit 3 [Stomoxys calcitrans]